MTVTVSSRASQAHRSTRAPHTRQASLADRGYRRRSGHIQEAMRPENSRPIPAAITSTIVGPLRVTAQ